MGTITINNDLMELYGVSMDTLHGQAMNNMDKISPLKFESIQETMVKMMASDFAQEEGIPLEEAKRFNPSVNSERWSGFVLFDE